MTQKNNEEAFNIGDLASLIEQQKKGGPCVSLYMPVKKEGGRENKIRLGNLIVKTKKYLDNLGVAADTKEKILVPAESILADPLFWHNLSDGLVFFATPEFSVRYRLPFVFQEIAVAGACFHLRPLFQFLNESGVFYLLVLSQKNVKFYRGTRNGINALNVPGLPKEIAEILPNKGYEKLLQHHGGGQNKTEIFHGHGGEKDARKINLEKLFRRIDAAIRASVAAPADAKIPLVIAGTDYFLPLYRSINTYPALLQDSVAGNFDKPGSDRALFQKAWAAAKQSFEQPRTETIHKYAELEGTGLTSHNIAEIIPAAREGRIEAVIIACGAHKWGIADQVLGQIIVHAAQEPGDEDLLDTAAMHTFLHRGAVFVASKTDMPDNAEIAAISRY